MYTAGALQNNNWDIVHEPQEPPEPIPIIGDRLPAHVLQQIHEASAAGADPVVSSSCGVQLMSGNLQPHEGVHMTAPQEARHQIYPYTEPVRAGCLVQC